MLLVRAQIPLKLAASSPNMQKSSPAAGFWAKCRVPALTFLQFPGSATNITIPRKVLLGKQASPAPRWTWDFGACWLPWAAFTADIFSSEATAMPRARMRARRCEDPRGSHITILSDGQSRGAAAVEISPARHECNISTLVCTCRPAAAFTADVLSSETAAVSRPAGLGVGPAVDPGAVTSPPSRPEPRSCCTGPLDKKTAEHAASVLESCSIGRRPASWEMGRRPASREMAIDRLRRRYEVI